ncbi:MAG: nucleotide exchange factor GrpE [Melioribacteraceae bacterium]|nr:nucleotide exchange factor GrpE [Melioribacteraceae bacterium]
MKKKKETMEEAKDQINQVEQSTNAENLNDDTNIEIEGKSTVTDSSSELNSALQKVSELEDRVKQLQDSLLRKAAEFENYKRRTENDQLNLLRYAAEPFIKSILIAYDDLERSLIHVNENNSYESFKKGLDLVFDKFTKILESQGVKKIEAKGKPFSVDFHEALMQQPSDKVPPHTVLDVIEQGYLYKDKVIRHAKVIVSAETIKEENKTNESEGNRNDSNLEG